MRKRTVLGVATGILGILIILGTPVVGGAWTLSWSPVTNWNDNTAIESQHLPMSYVVEWDNVVQPSTTATEWAIPQPSVGHGVSHVARVKAKTATGIEGLFSPPFSWSSPEGGVPVVRGIGVRQ